MAAAGGEAVAAEAVVVVDGEILGRRTAVEAVAGTVGAEAVAMGLSSP